jgi:hypothetical protein
MGAARAHRVKEQLSVWQLGIVKVHNFVAQVTYTVPLLCWGLFLSFAKRGGVNQGTVIMAAQGMGIIIKIPLILNTWASSSTAWVSDVCLDALWMQTRGTGTWSPNCEPISRRYQTMPIVHFKSLTRETKRPLRKPSPTSGNNLGILIGSRPNLSGRTGTTLLPSICQRLSASVARPCERGMRLKDSAHSHILDMGGCSQVRNHLKLSCLR